MRKLKHGLYKSISVLISVFVLVCSLPISSVCVQAADYSSSITFTFSSEGVTASVTDSSDYEISGTELAICQSGVYTVTGNCANGNIVVKKGVTDVVLILKNLTLACDYTSPIACNKTSAVTIYATGTVNLTDNEDSANENSTDADIADAFEGAGIKVKSGASLVIEGNGTLNVDASGCKNGIKGAATANITVAMDNSGSINVTAANSGLASDGNVLIKSGNISIKSANEGIKSQPDDGDTASAGVVTVTGGNIKIDTMSLSGGDGIQAANGINISGGTFDIDAYGDAIHSNTDVKISNGNFDLKTVNGYNGSGFTASTMSSKGIKASASDEDVEGAVNLIEITGGTYKINTPDDAVHSDGTVKITGGTFEIYSGDDGVHGDTELILGGALERDPFITVYSCYEGLEAGTVNITGGKYYIMASDDGINSAGGSSNGTDGGFTGGFGGGKDHFNPGGSSSTGGSYSLNISGGNLFVNAGGDGLDSNGALNLTGGTVEVWGASSGDNCPLDSDGTVTVSGATVFAAGTSGMGGIRPSGNQTYTTSTTRINAGASVLAKANSTAAYTTTAIKSVSYMFFSAPNTSSLSITTGTSSGCGTNNSFAHSFDNGTVTKEATLTETGIMTYTCSCGYSERQTIPMVTNTDVVIENYDNGYGVVFETNGNCTINIYYTHDYSIADEVNVKTAVSRSDTTGEPDSTGSGQVNFVVVPADGFIVESISATEGLYKNIKDVSEDSGIAFTYRVTKITGEIIVTIKTVSEDDTTVTTAATTTYPASTTAASQSETTIITEPAESTVATESAVTTTLAETVPSEIKPGSTNSTDPVETTVTDSAENPTQAVTEPYESGVVSNTTESVVVTAPEGEYIVAQYLYGDVDLNDKITIKDATLIQKVLAKLSTITDVQEILADVNASSSVTVSDATTIQKYCAFLIDSFKSGKWYIIYGKLETTEAPTVLTEPVEQTEVTVGETTAATVLPTVPTAPVIPTMPTRPAMPDFPEMPIMPVVPSTEVTTATEPEAETITALATEETTASVATEAETTEAATTQAESTEPETTAEAPVYTEPDNSEDSSSNTVYFSNNKDWTTVYAYCWSENGSNTNWPGVIMTFVKVNDIGEEVYSYEVPEGMTNIIFSDGNAQTVDIDLNNYTDNGFYLDAIVDGKYTVGSYPFN